MFLKRERPETDDFAIKMSGCEGKILSRNFNISRKIAIFFSTVSRHPYK